MDYFYELNI